MATFAQIEAMKTVFCTGAFFLMLFLISCGNEEEKQADKGVAVSQQSFRYSADFHSRLNASLEAYFLLKDAFVASDTIAVNKAAKLLRGQLDSLSLEELRSNDSTAFAAVNGRPGDILAELDALLAEASLQEKRSSFEMISTAFYDLLRTLRPAGTTAYFQYCPMAFDDKGAYWLSKTDSIRNPYFGAEMLTCGEVKEILKY